MMMNDTQKPSAAPLPGTGHTVHRFDEEMCRLRALVLEMAAHLRQQLLAATKALREGRAERAHWVLDRQSRIDALSLEADDEVFQTITRRQPAAIDLRIVLAWSRIAGELARASAVSSRIAREVVTSPHGLQPPAAELLEPLSVLDRQMLDIFEYTFSAIDAFGAEQALTVFEQQPLLTAAAGNLRAALANCKGDGAQMVSLVSCADGLEQLARHALAIAEWVIYVSCREDVRYRNPETVVEMLRQRTQTRPVED